MSRSAGHMRAAIDAIPPLLADPDVDARAAATTLAATTALDVVGCGTSLFAGMALRYAFEAVGLRCDTRQAYEYAQFPPPLTGTHALLGISHTGRTPDVVTAAGSARRAGCPVVAITDDPGSPLAHSADHVLADQRGPEPAMAKTRSYISTVARGLALARAWPGARRGRDGQDPPDPATLAPLAEPLLARSWEQAARLAPRFADITRVVVVGGGPEVATAHEAALKLTESAAVHADAWEIEEAAHGTWASTRAGELVIVLAPHGHRDAGARVLAGMRSIGATTWAVGADPALAREADLSTEVPEAHGLLAPLLSVLPMYCFAERLGRARGLDPDSMRQDDPRYQRARSLMRRSLPDPASH